MLFKDAKNINILNRKGYDDKEAEKLNNFLSSSVIVDKIAMNFFEYGLKIHNFIIFL